MAVGHHDLRVDEDHGLVLLFADVDDHEPAVVVHLAGGQADARRLVHGVEHVVEPGLERGIGDQCGVDRLRFGPQTGVGEFKN